MTIKYKVQQSAAGDGIDILVWDTEGDTSPRHRRVADVDFVAGLEHRAVERVVRELSVEIRAEWDKKVQEIADAAELRELFPATAGSLPRGL